ncbi:unnamed protein product [Bursaphelenchus okinawaensis]|uniref:Abnormal cell migration protein 18-like fibronectin type I domain-containing protein n=1 Tax=Bursaphelenchus okinawaensis TaxID=465554 RepID=A0A811LGQ8_9BILA|nr:unnamed protein product [Bursaphelenchus okinawaensis]CAG9122076.1 unnamed protein product [Bursaphelenchus okinawaensis]
MKLVLITLLVLLIPFSSAYKDDEPSCEENGETYRNGETWTAQSGFVRRCVVNAYGWETQILACVEKQSKRKIRVGSSMKVGKFRIYCDKTPGGGAMMRPEVIRDSRNYD